MIKQVFILNSEIGNAGVVKVLGHGNSFRLQFSLSKEFSGRNKCYIISNGQHIPAGIINKNKNSFEINCENPIDNIFLTPEMSENIIAWSGDKPPDIKTVKIDKDTSLPQILTFDNFFGGGFEWHRIRGNFIMFDYSIVHHILSSKKIYSAINRAGYYCAGIRKESDLTLIAIAFPMFKDTQNPFSDINADTYTIYKGSKEFCAICVGIDKTGEFFLSM